MRFAHIDDTVTGFAGRLIAEVDGGVVDVADAAGYGTLDELIASGPAAWEAARAAISEAPTRPGPRDLAAPLTRPSKIVCIGLNYHDHAVEQGLELPEAPLTFAKFPSALNAPDGVVEWSASITEQVDWEAELAVVVGRPLRRVDAAEALAGVFGYTAANDLSARDVQFSDGQWVRGKSLDGFLPLGPAVVTADEFGDPGGHRILARVNGEVMQDSSTDQLIFDIGDVLSRLSQSFTLLPGDLVLTGTPAGVGAFRQPPMFLGAGDVVEVEVEGIGVLRTTVAAAG